MSPEDRASLEDAREIVAIANAMLRVKSYDKRRAAVGLLTIMQSMLADDALGRIALAVLMAECIGELLRDIPTEQLPVKVDVRWWN
jgi:hypothetical protein